MPVHHDGQLFMFKNIICERARLTDTETKTMPYSPEHRQATRQRIVAAARRLFNGQGFSRVTIEQIMAEAQLTRGGFYHHFDNKEALLAEVIATYATCNPLAVEAARDPARFSDARVLARRLVDLYLSDRVCDTVELHCPLYALPSDALHAEGLSREAYTGLIRGITDVLRAALAGQDGADDRAQAILALCVGGMVLAKTVLDSGLRQTLRAAAHAQAVRLLEERALIPEAAL